MSYGTIRTNSTFLFLICCLTFVTNGFLSVLPGSSLALLAQDTHTPLSMAGLVFTVSSLGMIVAVIGSNVLIKHVGARTVVMAGLAGLVISSVLIPLTQNFDFWLGAELLQGISAGLINIGISITLTLNFGDRLSEKLNMLHGSVGLGSLLAPVVLSYALNLTHSPLVAFVVTSLVGVLCLSAFYALRFETHPGRQEPAAAVTACGGCSEAQVAHVEQAMQSSTVRLMQIMMLGLMALQVCFYVGAESGFSNWVVTSLSREANVTLQTATPAATFFWLGITGGRLLIAHLVKRGWITNARLLYISFICGGLSGALVVAFMTAPLFCFVACFGVGLFLGPIFPSVQAMATRRFAHMPGLISTVVLASSGFAGMTIPLSVGMALPTLGVREGMIIPALLSLSVALPFFLANKQEKKIVARRDEAIRSAEYITIEPVYDMPTMRLSVAEIAA